MQGSALNHMSHVFSDYVRVAWYKILYNEMEHHLKIKTFLCQSVYPHFTGFPGQNFLVQH